MDRAFWKAPAAAFLVGALVSGCGTVPEKLARPAQMSCLYLKEPISQIGEHGLASIAWETRLERGPYVSEREDAQGTYYRAPPGGVRNETVGNRENPLNSVRDGGIYIPKSAMDPPKIYYYFSVGSVPAEVPPEGMDCSKIGYITDPSGSKLDVVSVGTDGAIGGALGGVLGRAMAGGGMSYGQAAGVGAAGGLIGTVLVAEIVNADVGNIHFSWDLQDPAFIQKIKDAAAAKVAIKEIPLNAPAPKAGEKPQEP
jgi:hypothetical protein